jgi:hypothetical protein
MSDVIQRLRQARPEAAGPRDEVVESARAALVAEMTRERPPRRWGRRRVLGLAAPALAAALAAVVLGVTLTGKSDDPAHAAALVRVAEAAPRLLPDEAGWRMTGVGGLSLEYGELSLTNGEQTLDLHWLPREQYEAAVARGVAELDDLGTMPIPVADAEARLFRVPSTSEYVAVWVRGHYMVEAQASPTDEKAFGALLASLHEVGVDRWLEAIPWHMRRLRSTAEAAEVSRSAPSALAEMSVFSRPQSEADILPKRLHYRLRDERPCPRLGRPDGFCLGKPVPDESRLLLSGLGAGEAKLYAWPTSEGWVCWAWDAGAGSCAPDFAHGRVRASMMGIDPDELGVGVPGVLVGVVPDDVVAVNVIVDGVEYPAILGGNGFFYELPTAKCSSRSFDSIWLTFRDGSRDGRRLTMGNHIPPGTAPLSPTCP